jgi:nitrogen fixation NifU-like protein
VAAKRIYVTLDHHLEQEDGLLKRDEGVNPMGQEEKTDGNDNVFHRLLQIYTEKVVYYGSTRRNCGRMERPGAYAKITGSCSDTVEMFLRIQQGKVVAASYETDGCLTSHAAASAAAELAVGRTPAECYEVTQEAILDFLGGLPKDSEHCAKLAADTLHEAVRGYRVNPVAGLYGKY